MNEQVILLHGIARSSNHMKKVAKFLRKNNYTVYNLDYPSTKLKLQDLTEYLHKQISKHIDPNLTVHLIGYSMGGLLIRMYLNKYKIKNLGKVIQLATPNQGSEVADFLKNFWLYKKIYGLAGQQLTTNQESIKKDMDKKIDYPLGIIAGTQCVDPICYFLLPKPNDGKVSVANTKVTGMTAHTVVNASHLFFPYNKKVHQKILQFLKTELFNKEK